MLDASCTHTLSRVACIKISNTTQVQKQGNVDHDAKLTLTEGIVHTHIVYELTATQCPWLGTLSGVVHTRTLLQTWTKIKKMVDHLK